MTLLLIVFYFNCSVLVEGKNIPFAAVFCPYDLSTLFTASKYNNELNSLV